ncbi:mTERF domain-containing protein [Cephalotus follicularis]|uniref:mTERF domain-containing protein n=1 Tax=Cephalotus follicularis TaxID=3775 RepID=A0A1Q3CPG0_CEPFO|nr:mTERF domain-containing protein [Cephalotus follicularis]
MMSCHLHHHHHQFLHNPTTLLHVSSLNHNHKSPPPQDHNLRIHNSKSTSLLLHHFNNTNNPQTQQQQQTLLSNEEKSKLLLLALATKRTPQFPIYTQSLTDTCGIASSSLPPLQTLFHNGGNGVDEDMILRALEIRRKLTAEIFKEAMRKGKFGITYSTNLVNKLSDFTDFVMIKAAALKRLPEFQNSSFNVRAKAVIEGSGVVPLIRWLKHNKLSYPKIAKLICLSRGNLESINHLARWLKTIHVRSEFLGVVLLKSGESILERSIEELNEIVEYLERNGVMRDWMGYVLSRCPQLLSYSMEELKLRVGFYLDMGMNVKDFGTMVFDFPRVLGYFTLEEMNQKVNYLKEFGLSHEDVGRLVAFKPELMSCSIEDRWKPLVKYLYYLGISRDGMRRMLIIKPMVFCVELQTTIVPKVRFFQDIGIRDDAIGNMLVRFPSLLTFNLYKKIRPVVIFLMTKAGVSERDIGKVIALAPELLGCHIVRKLEFNVKYFLSLGIQIRQLGEMIADFPLLLRYNVDLLRPKYRYLRRTMVRPLQDLIEFPRFFSYSLDDRIIPRHGVLVENRINFKLWYMLACTDEQFTERVLDEVERRRRFESGIMDVDLTASETAGDSLEASGIVNDDPIYAETADNSLEESGIVDDDLTDSEAADCGSRKEDEIANFSASENGFF